MTVTAGILDLGGTMAAVTTATLTSGSIVDGTLQVGTMLELYSGMVSANITGPAVLNKLGSGSILLAGDNTYSGGTNALDGTLVAAINSLPGAASGPGTVIVQPTLYWSGSGDWTTGQWQLADGTPTPWLDGSSIVIAAGSSMTLSGTVNVTAVTIEGNATIIGGGTLSLPSPGTTIDVLSGTATIAATLAAGGFAEGGAGTLVLDGPLNLSGTAVVDQGTLDVLSPLASAPAATGGRAIGPGAVFSGNESLYALDPAMFSLVQSLFADQAIDRTDMIQILQSAVVAGGVTDDALAALETLTTSQGEAALNMPILCRSSRERRGPREPGERRTIRGRRLGNLADQRANLRATVLDDLVDKWFYGTDLPAIPAWTSYSVAAGPLFGDNQEPSSADDEQGSLGDCYLISALGRHRGQFACFHRRHDYRQRRRERHADLDCAVLPSHCERVRAGLRYRERPVAGLQRECRLRKAGPGRELVDADHRKGVCPVERDRPRGPRWPELL